MSHKAPRSDSRHSVTQSLKGEAFRQRAMAPPPWTQIVSPLMADGKPDSLARETKDSCNAKFAMRAVPARAAELGYAEDSDYDKLTRKQRKEATRFTHRFDVVGVHTLASQHSPRAQASHRKPSRWALPVNNPT